MTDLQVDDRAQEGVYKTNVLIVGGGPAGIQAARLIRRFRPAWEVTVLRPEPHSLVYCALPYAIEGLFPLERTFKSDSLLTDVGARLIRKTATGLNLAARLVTLEDGSSIAFEKLLIATGAVPIRPPVPGADLENVFVVKTAKDAELIMARLPDPDVCGESEGEHRPSGKAVVVGSGAIGIEQAIAYRARGVEVHLVEMRDHVLPHLVDADTAAPLSEALEEMGVQLHLGARLEEIEGGTSATGVRLSKDERIALNPKTDFVVLAVGMKPDIDVFVDAGIEAVRDGIVVDEKMRTRTPGVWAAGDCVAYQSGIDGKPLGGKLATNAVPMAKIAARDMVGFEAKYPGFFNGAATVVKDLRVAGTGFTEVFAASRGLDVFATHDSTATRFPMMPKAGNISVKLIFERGSGRLIGAQAVGDEAVAERIDLCTFAIQKEATARDLAELAYSAQPWQTFFPARNAIVEAATKACDILDGLA